MAKRQVVTPGYGVGAIVMIRVEDLHPRADNARRIYDKDKLKELTASIKENGVVEPLLVRSRVEGGYEVVAGERRRRAVRKAEMAEAPCYVREMTDDEAAFAGAVENLQREGLDPIDEAVEFVCLLEKSKSVKDLARRLGKDAKFVARRLPLADLIEEAAEDLRAGRITVGHALEIARLPREVQSDALTACYGTEWKNGAQTVDKGTLGRTIEELRQWIERNLLLDLARAPFKLDDERLREDGLACLKCPQRTGHNRALFDDLLNDKDQCLNRECFANKASAFVKLEAMRIKPKESDEPAPIISNSYYEAPEGMLNRNQFVEQKASERCASAERAVWGHGPEFGKAAWICRDPECPKHARRVSRIASNGASSNGYSTSGAAADQRKAARRQELLDIKVNEAVRRKVFKASLPTYKYPLPREMRDKVAFEFFERLPGHHQKVIEAVLEQAITEEVIAAMDDDQLATFMMFCTFSHYGANEYGQRRAPQRDVIALAEDRGINYALIDAETRLELSPKKYAKEHQLYLDAVRAGKASTPPNVYGDSPVAAAEASGEVGDNEEDINNIEIE